MSFRSQSMRKCGKVFLITLFALTLADLPLVISVILQYIDVKILSAYLAVTAHHFFVANYSVISVILVFCILFQGCPLLYVI